MPHRLYSGVFLVILSTLAIADGGGGLPAEMLGGTCEDFNNFVVSKGAKSDPSFPDSRRRPKSAGMTTAHIEYTANYRSAPGTGDETCTTSAWDKNTFNIVPFTQVLQWKAPSGVSDACRKQLQDWTKQIVAHENRHRADIARYAEDVRSNWKSKQIRVCASSRNDSEAAFEKEAKAYLDQEQSRFASEIEAMAEKFHNTPEGGPVPRINCSACK